jgi:uncharacterized membrane protein YedE/YeeE
MILLLVLLLAALLGFTAHSASICAVKAVSEVITTHHSHMLNSFGKTAMWILTAMMLLMVLAPGSLTPTLRAPSLFSIFGAFLFGAGAALNGGCAISTVTRLGNGEFRMALTIVGIVLAIAAIDGGLLALPVTARQTLNPFVLGYWELRLAVALLLGWAIHETITLWRRRDRSCGLVEGLFHRPWRLSTAAAVIGLTNVAIAAVAGHWAYTGTLRDIVGANMAGLVPPSTLQITLFAALMTGVVCSALLRRTYALRCRPKPEWLRNLSGGMLMGVGIVAVPGGNDGLLLDAIPSLSPHAIPAFIALLTGIAAVKLAAPRFSDVGQIDCGGDVCREI